MIITLNNNPVITNQFDDTLIVVTHYFYNRIVLLNNKKKIFMFNKIILCYFYLIIQDLPSNYYICYYKLDYISITLTFAPKILYDICETNKQSIKLVNEKNKKYLFSIVY